MTMRRTKTARSILLAALLLLPIVQAFSWAQTDDTATGSCTQTYNGGPYPGHFMVALAVRDPPPALPDYLFTATTVVHGHLNPTYCVGEEAIMTVQVSDGSHLQYSFNKAGWNAAAGAYTVVGEYKGVPVSGYYYSSGPLFGITRLYTDPVKIPVDFVMDRGSGGLNSILTSLR